MKNQVFKRFYAFLLLFSLVHWVAIAEIGSGPSPTQAKTVAGTVIDAESKEPLIGATIIVKGTSVGTVTDIDGKYALQVDGANAIITASYVGFSTVEETVGNRSIIDFELRHSESLALDEVVVVGYGVQKKANVVGSVTTLQGSEIKSIPATSVTNTLAGRLPGVVAIQKNGEPGNLGSRLLVRGRTTLGDDGKTGPLVVIDGVQGRSIDEIDPNDVASVSVLKDASAAIYGAQAANGVILITTKNGESRVRPRLNYNFYQGFMTPTKIPEMASAAEYATMLSEYQEYKGSTRTYTDEDIELFRSGIDPWEHPNTDWYDELIKKWTITSRHNLTVDGGFKGMTYYLSLGYKKDDAIYKQSSTSYDQYNLRAKMNFPITDWLHADVNTAYFETHREYPYRGAGDIIGSATRLVPTSPAFWPTGEPGPDVEYGDNPVVTSSFAGGKNDQKRYRSQNTFKVSIKPPFIKGLSLNGSFDYDISNFYRKRFYHPWTLYFPNWSEATRDPVTGFITSMPLTPALRSPNTLSSTQNEEDYERTIYKTYNFNITYSRKFGDHDVSAYAGYEQYETNDNSFGGYREGYISNLIQIMNAGAVLNQRTYGKAGLYARKSFIFRANYSFKEKYLVEFLFRRDGSLKFPPDKRWGNFPGFLLGWRASEETFWKENLSIVNYFKLRGSYGVMGMDPGSAYQYLNNYSLGDNKYTGMVFGTNSVIQSIFSAPNIANPYITWETQTTQNIGFESQFVDGMFHLSFDLFKNKRDDILATRNASVPKFTGLSLPSENIARVDNKGFELEAGFHKTFNSDWRIDFGGNFNFNRNKVVYKDEPERSVPWQRETGRAYGVKWLYKAIGIFRDEAHVNSLPHWKGAGPGDIIFEDVDVDGEITADDRILLDKSDAPEITYGINMDVRWKNFSLSLLFQGQGTYYKQSLSDDRRGEAGNYFKWMYNDRWTTENTNASVPRPYNRSDQYWGWATNNSTYWFDNTAYLRLKNVVVAYDIPTQYFKSLGITRATINLSGNNLFLLYSATKKFDPEVDGTGSYPLMRTFAIGANITF